MASASTYSRLRRAADAVGAWDIERDAARLALRERDLGGLVDALLADSDIEEAWSVAHEDPDWDPGLQRRLRLAEASEAQRPDRALPWYMLVVDELLIETGRRAYARAIPVLKHAAAPPTRPARASGLQPGSLISASITAAAQHSSRCSTRPASADAPTEAASRPSWGCIRSPSNSGKTPPELMGRSEIVCWSGF